MRPPCLSSQILGFFCLMACAAGLDRPVLAETPPETQREQLHGEVAALIRGLDSSHYEVRQQACRQLETLISKPELGTLLAAEFQQLLVKPELSFEVRWHLARWRPRLPITTPEPPPTVSRVELDKLVQQLDDDVYSVRLGAEERLQWLAGNPKLAGSIMARLKERMAIPDLSTEAYRRLESVRKAVWTVWFAGDPDDSSMPAVSDAQMERWLDDLIHPITKQEQSRPWLLQQIARQELMDLLARDSDVPRVKRAIESRLSGSIEPKATGRLKELLDLTRPAMVCEYWQGRQQHGEQHLIVGVPCQVTGATNPSHFDRIDDRSAHCVSGNSLSRGDYPVGVAFPHPMLADAIFHLVNLPTPRRQIAYSYEVKTDAAVRLAKISRRTLDRFLAEKHALADAEIGMLAQLDPREVSRFAGRYFFCVDDAIVEEDDDSDRQPLLSIGTTRGRMGGQSSRHGMICAQLAVDGTKDAMPGLVDALAKKRFRSPTPLGPYRFPELAALAIARRDPWQGADSWLAEQVEKNELLMLGRDKGPELGATAARLLLKRHQESMMESFDLEVAADPLVASLGIEGYRFKSLEGPKKVLAWWARNADSKTK